MINRHELARRSRDITSAIHVGKNGITNDLVLEINRQLKKQKLVKIKLLRSALEIQDKKSLASDLADKTGALLVQQIGNVVVLYKK